MKNKGFIHVLRGTSPTTYKSLFCAVHIYTFWCLHTAPPVQVHFAYYITTLNIFNAYKKYVYIAYMLYKYSH